MKVNYYKKIIYIPCAVILVLGGFLLLNRTEKISTAIVKKGDVSSTIEVSGKLYGENEQVVSSDVTGKVSKVYVEEGNIVDEKTVLLKFDVEDLKKSLDSAQYNYEYYKNGYDAAVEENAKNQQKYNEAAVKDADFNRQYDEAMAQINGLEAAQYAENVDIVNHQKALQREIAKLNQVIAEKTSELSVLQLKTTLATFEQKGWDVQFLEGQAENISKELLELNTKVIEKNKNALELPEAQMSVEEYTTYLEVTKKINDISRDWAEVKTDKATAEAKILNEHSLDQMKSSVSIARVAFDTAKEDYDAAVNGMNATISGIVTRKNVADGAYVTKGTSLFTIEGNRQYKVTVDISKYDYENIAIGQDAKVIIGNNLFDGIVDKIHYAAVTDSSDNAKIKVDILLKEVKNQMVIGLEADVTINVGTKENVLLLPQTALYTDDKGTYCYTVKNSVVGKSYINVGMKGKGVVEVLDGLETDAHVVIDAITDSKVGHRVNEKIN